MSSQPADVEALQDEVIALRRKVKYIQSVSTIFRQKISLIMRETARDPDKFHEFHKMYTKVASEATAAEMKSDAVADIASDIATPRGGQAKFNHSDIRKAHQLCLVLQEKNELKSKEVALRADLDALQRSYDDLNDRHAKVLDMQAQKGVPAALREQFAAREQEMAAEMAQLRSQLEKGGGRAADETLQKQHAMMKARVTKLKEELAATSARATEDCEAMRADVESLATQLQAAKAHIAAKDAEMARLRDELAEANRIAAAASGTEGMLKERLAAMEKANDGLRRGEVEAETSRTEDLQNMIQTSNQQASKVHALQQAMNNLQEQLSTERTLVRHKDLEIATLMKKCELLAAREDAQSIDADQKDIEQSAVRNVYKRVVEALGDLQQAQNTADLKNKVSGIGDQLKRLEFVEEQLRQKEDLLVIKQEENDLLKESLEQLQTSVTSVSACFAQLPVTVEAAEAMIVTLDAYRAELNRCVEANEAPVMARVEAHVELRQVEAESMKASSRSYLDSLANDPLVLQYSKNANTVEGSVASALNDSKHNAAAVNASAFGGLSPEAQAEEEELLRKVDEAIANIPDISHLVDLDAPLPPCNAVPLVSGLDSPAGTRSASHARGASPNTVTETDMRLTFQLFDENQVGRLDSGTLGLCLTTLGLPTSLVTPGTSMGEKDFVRVCMAFVQQSLA